MTIPATHIDLYQLTSLIPHWDAGLGSAPVTMSFFSRRLPRNGAGEPVRGFLLWVGLRRCLQWLSEARFDESRLNQLEAHPLLGAALRQRPTLRDALLRWRFHGTIAAPPEGTPLWAGGATIGGQPVDEDGIRPSAQCPYLQVGTDLLSAKLIETPLLSIINQMTMVGSKAARIVLAAGERGVLEFGTRRTHPQAAVDAAYAAYIAGCAGTSNVEAHCRYGVPVLGTMDHFAVQAWEKPGVPRHETERAYFRQFYQAFPHNAVLLVDTYDTYGEQTGIRNAVAATDGNLRGIRLDSKITVPNVRRARDMLDDLGATGATIVLSGGLDEYSIAELAAAPADHYGIGERLVTSPDAPVGVGAVGKLCKINGKATMKLAKGSGKATLPGAVQVFRQDFVDTVGCADETLSGTPLLQTVWRDHTALALPPLEETRRYALAQVRALPAALRAPREVQVAISPRLHQLIQRCVRATDGTE